MRIGTLCNICYIVVSRELLLYVFLQKLLHYLNKFTNRHARFVSDSWASCCLNKCCELKQRFSHVWHGIDQTILDNPIDEWRGRLRTHGHICGHFQQLLWQFSHRRFSFVLNVTRFWILECIFGNYHIFGLLNFCKLGWQHTQGMVGSIILVFLEINFSFQQWKNFENLLRIIDKVIAISLVYYFFATQCIKFVNVLSK